MYKDQKDQGADAQRKTFWFKKKYTHWVKENPYSTSCSSRIGDQPIIYATNFTQRY